MLIEEGKVVAPGWAKENGPVVKIRAGRREGSDKTKWLTQKAFSWLGVYQRKQRRATPGAVRTAPTAVTSKPRRNALFIQMLLEDGKVLALGRAKENGPVARLRQSALPAGQATEQGVNSV